MLIEVIVLELQPKDLFVSIELFFTLGHLSFGVVSLGRNRYTSIMVYILMCQRSRATMQRYTASKPLMWHLMVQRGINGYLVVILLIHGYSCLKKHVIANVWLIGATTPYTAPKCTLWANPYLEAQQSSIVVLCCIFMGQWYIYVQQC